MANPTEISELKAAPGQNPLGLRARITLAFTLGALALSIIIGVSTVALTRRALLAERENRAAERVKRNAAIVSDALAKREGSENPTKLIDSIQSPAQPLLWIRTDELTSTGEQATATYSSDDRINLKSIPVPLRNQAMWSQTSGMMRADVNGQPSLIIGISLDKPEGSYYEIESLADVRETIGTIMLVLALTGSVTVFAGATLGWWASRRALRPLTLIADAARQIADGRLETRLQATDYAEDAELGPLVSSFNEMVAALQDRIDQDARFASDVSHELRSPLTTLLASVEVLRNAEGDLPPRARTAVDLLATDVTRFSQLVEDLLEISRFDAGAMRLDLEETVIGPVVARQYADLERSGTVIDIEEDLNNRVLLADSRRVMRILANFADNARKYAGGVERVTVRRVDEEVWFEVDDAGPGVPADERLRIFSRFSRGTQGGARGSDRGSGLGLALVAEHARLQGGRAWVEDRPDGEMGARFVFALPFIDADEELFNSPLTVGDDAL